MERDEYSSLLRELVTRLESLLGELEAEDALTSCAAITTDVAAARGAAQSLGAERVARTLLTLLTEAESDDCEAVKGLADELRRETAILHKAIPSEDELDDLASKEKKPTILVVDDKENILKLSKTMSNKEAYELQTASGGFVALATIKQKPPHLLFIDIDMPGMSGIELYEKVKSVVRKNKIKVVGLALRTAEEQTTRARKAGIHEILPKPFFKEDLARILAKLCGDEAYLTESEGVKLLAFPEQGDARLQKFKSALKTDILREINEMADEGDNKLVIQLSGVLNSDLALAQNLAALLEHLEKLKFEVRLVADTQEARDGLNQYLEMTRKTAYASVAEAVGALG